jgi:hypothetical protein
MSYMTAIAAGANFALPYLVSLGKIHVWIPLIVMGLIAITSGITVAFLPETLNENLPQTLQDGDSFGAGQEFFSFAKTKKSSKERKEGDDIKLNGKDVEGNGNISRETEVSILKSDGNHTLPTSITNDE